LQAKAVTRHKRSRNDRWRRLPIAVLSPWSRSIDSKTSLKRRNIPAKASRRLCSQLLKSFINQKVLRIVWLTGPHEKSFGGPMSGATAIRILVSDGS
jgi:hypothetical protein